MAQLSISRPGHLDETVLLPDGELMLGRQPGSDVVVDHPSVYRQHALIAEIAGGHVIRDIGSTNGTWVNGVRVGDQPVLLQPDDQIFLGEEGVVLAYLAEEAVAQAPARQLVWVRAALGIAIVGTIAVAVAFILLQTGGGDTDLPPGGPVTIPTTRAVEISIKGGATLSIPEGAFSEEVELSVLRKEKSELPDTIDTSVLVSNIYEVEQNGLADLNKLLTVSLPYQGEALPQVVLPEDLTVVRWDGERWEELPSTVDTAAKMVSAQVGHFSFVSIAASTTAYFRGLDQSYTVVDDSGSPLFIIQYASKGSHEPPESDYVQRLGTHLKEAKEKYTHYFAGTGVQPSFPISVLVFDLPYGTGVPGYTNYGTQFLRITNDNPSNSLKAVAAHEFFHLWQYAHLNYFTKEKHDWWLEATARWAEEYVFPDLDLYIDDVQQYAPKPPLLGFKEIASRKQERYAAASLAFYLESYSPGFIARTYDSESGLNFRSEPWYTTFGRLLGGDFSDEFNDYVVTYFYRWRFDSKVPDIKEWFPTGGGYIDNDLTRPIPNVAKRLVTATVKLSPETPSDLVRDAGGSSLGFLPPLSGQLIKVSIDGNVKNAHLVFRQSGSEADGLLRVTIFPGPNEKTGIVLDPDDGRQLLIENIVENGMNQVYVVVSNPFVTRNSYLGALYLDLEVYLLQPPEGLNIAEVGDGRLSLTWKASPLSQGDMPGDNGALRRYRIYRQNTGQEPLAAVDASMTSWEFTH